MKKCRSYSNGVQTHPGPTPNSLAPAFKLVETDIMDENQIEFKKYCIDVFNDFSESEVKKEPVSIQRIWEFGKALVEEKTSKIPLCPKCGKLHFPIPVRENL